MNADATATSRLLALPLEVLLAIASHLTTPEYGHLRLTCRHLEAALFSSFSREFFTKRQFMLTEFSLQALVAISRSRLAPSMTHVIISVDRPALIPLHSALLNGHDPVKANNLRREYTDHLTLVNGGYDVDMMAEAFGNLPNLNAVGLRDFNSRSRYRDGAEWKSYGAVKFLEETDIPLSTAFVSRGPVWGGSTGADNWPIYQTHIFHCILRALNKAGVRPHSFQVILRHIGLDDHAFNLPRFVHVQPVLAELRTLFLDLHDDRTPIAVDGGDGQTRVDCPYYLLRGFLGHLTQLRHLRLNFRSVGRQRTEDLLSWLARPATQPKTATPATLFSEVPLPVDFPHLTELNVGMATIRAAALLGLAQKFRNSLQRLELHKVTLRETSASGLDSDQKTNHWAKFLRQLPNLHSRLTGLVLSSVSQGWNDEGRYPDKVHVRFTNDSANREIMRWSGQDLEGGVKDILNSMSIIWPAEPSDHSSMEDVDDSGDEDGSDAESETNDDTAG